MFASRLIAARHLPILVFMFDCAFLSKFLNCSILWGLMHFRCCNCIFTNFELLGTNYGFRKIFMIESFFIEFS